MSQSSFALLTEQDRDTATMRALMFHGQGQISLETVPIPKAGIGEVVIRVTLTTICGTDLHILKGEYPVKPGLIIGHEPVGVIHEIGQGVTEYEVGDRVLVGAITPCGQCSFCLGGNWSQCGGAIGGWKFGNTIDGAQAEYLRVPYAQANLAKIPDQLHHHALPARPRLLRIAVMQASRRIPRRSAWTSRTARDDSRHFSEIRVQAAALPIDPALLWP